MLWLQNWKKKDFVLVTVSFLHIESRVIPLMKALSKTFISSLPWQALSNLTGRYDPRTKKNQIFPCNCVISSHRVRYYTSIESCHRWLHFTFLHRQPLSYLWVPAISSKTATLTASKFHTQVDPYLILCKVYFSSRSGLPVGIWSALCFFSFSFISLKLIIRSSSLIPLLVDIH